MCQLFEYQQKTLKKLVEELSQESFIVLCGEEGTGKTFLVEKGSLEEKFNIIWFQAELKEKFVDYNCIPSSIMKDFISSMKKKNNGVSFAKDIASTISNIAFISIENVLETLLSADEECELESMLTFFVKKVNKENQLFVFDCLDNYDNKGLLFLHKIIGAVMNGKFYDTKVLILLDTYVKGKKELLDEVYFEQSKSVNIEKPSDNDLAKLVDKSLYSIARHIPIKYLLELGNNCSNIKKYYNDKLNTLAAPNDYIKRIILPLSLFDEMLSFHNLALLLSELTSYELAQGLKILNEQAMIDTLIRDQSIYYKVPDIVRDNIRKSIPEYIATYRFEIFTRKLEEEVPFSYILKYRLYLKIGNYDNAYANAILAYCSIVRGDINSTNEELLNLNKFLLQSPYSAFFQTIEKAYKAYNVNDYVTCYNIIEVFLKEKNIWKNNHFMRSIYLPEFIFEFIYLREMCVGRIYEENSELIKNEITLLKESYHCFKALNNDELLLRLEEKELLLQSYVSIQTRTQQKEIFNHYFRLCDIYKEHIRMSNTVSLRYWEIRYASFLYKINIISDVPDKKYILQSGYLILERNKENFWKKYLRAACNYAGDLMWRNNNAESLEILKQAVDFITARNIERYWGIILQMYTFAKLYSEVSVNPKTLLQEYEKNVWNKYDIRNKMHEPIICISNYAILQVAAGNIQKAYKLLDEAWEECRNLKKGYYNLYLVQTNLAAVEYLRGNSCKALELESSCKSFIDKKLIPTFSYPFLKKRNLVLCNIYQNEHPVDNVLVPLEESQILSTGYCSDNYMRLLLFSDINYWTD